jgi:hypothetical protein
VLNEWSFLMLIVVLAGVIGLSVVKQLTLPALPDLIQCQALPSPQVRNGSVILLVIS